MNRPQPQQDWRPQGRDLDRERLVGDLNRLFRRVAIASCGDAFAFYGVVAEAVQRSIAGYATEELCEELERLIESRPPLSARRQPACRHCGLCEDLAEGLRHWLDANLGKSE